MMDEIDGRVKPPAEASKPWLPDGMEPVFEELPKWDLLADVLHEIEEEIMRQESLSSCEPSLPICLTLLKRFQTVAVRIRFWS